MSTARDMVAKLAMVIARWPGQWWIREHDEVPELLESMVQVVVEEIREAQRAQKIVDTNKAQDIVDQLHLLSVECEKEISLRKRLERQSRSVTPATTPVSESPAAPPAWKTIAENSVFGSIDKATASCWFTGFLFGTFVTLCLFSHHRRELLLVT